MQPGSNCGKHIRHYKSLIIIRKILVIHAKNVGKSQNKKKPFFSISNCLFVWMFATPTQKNITVDCSVKCSCRNAVQTINYDLHLLSNFRPFHNKLEQAPTFLCWFFLLGFPGKTPLINFFVCSFSWDSPGKIPLKHREKLMKLVVFLIYWWFKLICKTRIITKSSEI